MPAPNRSARLEARRLRAELGLPLRRIADELGVSVSSVHAWTRGIELSATQREHNQRQARRQSARTWARINREQRIDYQRAGRRLAMRGDPLHLAGCMLYWAEGGKDRNRIRFCNSDPDMLRFFRRFLVQSLGIAPDRLTLSLHVYLGNGLTLVEIEDCWLRLLELPRSALRKHSVDPLPTSSSGRRAGRLPQGGLGP